MATSINLEESLKLRVQNLANRRQRSTSSIMREAISEYVERDEARESFKQEAMASWSAYQSNGQHLTNQEITHWLNAWGTDNEVALPKCHK